jgi:hypothetical protein
VLPEGDFLFALASFYYPQIVFSILSFHLRDIKTNTTQFMKPKKKFKRVSKTMEEKMAEAQVANLLLEVTRDGLVKELLKNLDDIRETLLDNLKEDPTEENFKRARLVMEIEKEHNLYDPVNWISCPELL